MKSKHLAVIYVVLLLCSCIGQPPAPDSKGRSGSTKQNQIITPPLVTVIADLPDSIQPKSYALSEGSKPLTITIPQKSGGFFSYTDPVTGEVRRISLEPPVTSDLPVLKNETGVPLKDQSGEPFILGEGGISNFTNYNSDNGLAVDVVVSAIMDRRGDLWFGTLGGGVSRFDGTRFTNYSPAHGLAHNYVWSIAEDHAGNLWFGTALGVSRFDGKSFITYTVADGLASSIVRSLAFDNNGNLWLGTHDGLSKFDGKRFTTFTTTHGLADNRVWCILNDKKGNLWFGTSNGLTKYDGNHFTNFTKSDGLSNNEVLSIAEDKNGNLWVGTRNGGVSRYDGNHFTTFTMAHGLANNEVWSIREDINGQLWFGTVQGLSRYDGHRFFSYTTSQGLPNDRVRSITTDKTGNLWLGTRGGGVSRYNGTHITTLTTAQGLASNRILDILEDKSGNLWFATENKGVSCFNGKHFITYTTHQGLLSDQITAVTQDKRGHLWFGTNGGGVSRYDGHSLTTYTTAQGLASNSVFSIAEDKNGNLWLATSGGANRFDGKKFITYTHGLCGNSVLRILVDTVGNIWFGSLYGLSRFDGQSFTCYTTEQGLTNNVVKAIAKDETGNLWFGTDDGLNFLHVTDIPKLPDANNKVDGSGKHENPSIEDNENSAKVKGSDDDNARQLFQKFTTSPGLPDNHVLDIIPLTHGKMAAATNQGIVLFNSFSDQDQDLKGLPGLEILNTQSGYPMKEVSEIYLDSRGMIWAGTSSELTSLVRIDFGGFQKKVAVHNKPPIVTIQQIRINEEAISWSTLSDSALNQRDSVSLPSNITEEVTIFGRPLTDDERNGTRQKFAGVRFGTITKFYPVPQELILPYAFNRITIDFAANELATPDFVRYQYMLEGYDRDWSPVVKNTSATFGNIREGSYNFKVKSQYLDAGHAGSESWSEPVNFTFTVLPPWYRAWWSYALYVLAFALSILVFIRWRTNALRHGKLILEQEVSQRTRELKEKSIELEGSLEKIKAAQSQLIQSEKMASLGELTAGIAHEIQNPLNFVNNFSEVNKELLSEMKEEIEKGNLEEVKSLASNVIDNQEKINEHGKRADAIVKGMLQHSRSSTGIKEPTNINTLAEEYLKLAYHGLRAKDKTFNVTLKTDFDERIGSLNVIPQDIGRVMLNLLNNAFYAVHEKTKQTGGQFEPLVYVSTKISGDKVLISVKDNGNGIPQSIADKIFQPFFTTKPTGQGTGLGLSLSYDIVKAHGGDIKVETVEGQFSEFIILLPKT